MMLRPRPATKLGDASADVGDAVLEDSVVRTRRPRVEGDREAEILEAAVQVLADVGDVRVDDRSAHR